MNTFFTEAYTSEGLLNGRHFADDKFEFIFLYENGDIFIQILFKFILNALILTIISLWFR